MLFLFVSQLVTGICLAVYYVPSPEAAHVTLAYIIKDVAGGAFLRSLHSYGASAMVVVLALHFLQTFLYGSYKGKRELLWISGVVLSLLVLGMTFTGFLLRWDLRAYFAGSVGTNIAGDVPFVGGWLIRMLRGGAVMGALTLSRFYLLHVLVLPAAIGAFIAVHIFLFRKAGAAGSVREDPVQPSLTTEAFYPHQVIIDMGFVLVVMGIVGMLAHFVPVTLGPVADPSNSNYLPRPEWYYLPFFQWLKFWDGAKTVVGVVIIPAILIILVFLLPFLDRGRERRPWKRPIPVGSVLIVLIGVIGLGMQSRLDDSRDAATATQIAQQNLQEAKFFRAPFEPSASSLASAAAPATLTGPALHGQSLFQSHSCSSCHGVDGTGGSGPALTHIAAKFPPSQLAALIKTPNAMMKAGGMTPLSASAADLAALVAYLTSLGSASAGSTTAAAPTGAPPAGAGVTASAPTDSSSTPPVAAAVTAPGASAKTSGGPGAPAALAASSDTTSAKPLAGGKLFQSDGCAACHGVGGKGTPRAVALLDVGSKFSSAQLTALLRTPSKAMTAGGMPPVPGTAIASLVAYLGSLKSAAGAHGQAVANKAAPAVQAPQTVAAGSPPPTPRPAAATSPQTAAASPAATATPPAATTTQAVATATPATTSAGAPPANSQRGAALFTARGCAACHGLGGVGTKTAPALIAFSKTVTPAALTTLLEHPNQKMQSGGMPATNLSAADMSALVAYLQHLGGPVAATGTVAAKPTATSPTGTPPANKSPNAADTAGGQVIAAVSPGDSSSGGAAPPRSMNALELRGQMAFAAHSCATCHGVNGVRGSWAGPALANTGKNFPAALLTTLLQHPTARMRQGGMPPYALSASELNAVAAYVAFISASKPATTPPP